MKTLNEFIMEEKLSADDRNEMDDSDFGIPETRSFPLKGKNEEDTKTHITQAMRMFPHADDRYKDALAKRILRAAKAHGIDTSNWKINKKNDKPTKESVGPLDDDTTGTSEFEESFDNEPDDCYTESDVFITEADKAFMKELQKKNDQIPLMELNKYGKKLIHYFNHGRSRTLVVNIKGSDAYKQNNHLERRCDEYYGSLIKAIDKFANDIEPNQIQPIKWYKYDKLVKTLFHSIGINYNKDRVLGQHAPGRLYFEEREYKKYKYDPTTDVLVHRSNQKSLTVLKPTHCSRDGVTYPRPRIYFFLEKRSNLSSLSGNEYGNHIYVVDVNKSFDVYHDMEYGKRYEEEKDKYGKPVFINTVKPMKIIPIEKIMNDHVTESYYTESEKPGKLMKVPAPDSKYVYFASPENYMPEMKLDRPLFVTPYKSIASIFISRDMELQNRIPRGSYNCQYEEWLKFNKKESGRCLKDVHVYIEGYPDLEPYEIKQTGYVHQILTHNWNDNYYRYPWMDASKEWLIVNDNGNVEFDDVTECEITYHISGKPGYDKLGPRQDALESFVKHAIKLIHDKYKKDQKDPIGNQNCLLCTWCFEARMRGLDVLPRPVYSPRDDVLDIPGNQIVFSSRQIKLKNYTDLASEITKAGDGCRFYCHVNWKDSKGGHEFILMRIGGKNYVVDPQQGKIEPLTKSHNYVSDINYDNSYIVQLSGKKFNRNLFDKWNDESTVLRWDPDKDIPYMLKEGMITKEEAEKELRKSSTERFTSELKRELKNNPVQESALPKRIRFRPATESDIPNIRKWKLESINQSVRNKPNVLKFIEKDCYDNLKNTKMILDGKDVIGILEAYYIDDGEWWYIGEIYIDEAHRGKGIGTSILKQEIKRHDRLILRVAKDNQKAIKLYRSLGFTISKDEKFSWIMTLDKSKPVQEGVIQNIKNKVSPFEKNLVYHISPEGHLDGQIFKPRVPDYLDKYDPSKTEFEDVETPRVCFSPSIEGCLNAIIVNIGRWKTANKLRDWYVYIPEKPLSEYKYRTNKQLVDEKKVYDANLTKEIWIEEPVRLKQYGIIRIDSVTDKSRKKAVPTTLGEAKKRNVYDFKWHWLVKPKVLKDVPYDYSPLEVCKDMVADLERYKYGIPENGRIVGGSEHDYDTKWKLQSPEEFEKNGGGICYDFVEFEEGYLDAYGIKCKKYFMSTDLPGHDTHTFVLVEDGKGGFVYPESSFEKVAGTHEVKSVEEAIKIVADGFWKINDNINKTNEFKYYVWEFTGHPKYGSNIKQCNEYYSKGEPIFESNCLKPGKSQPIREFVTHFRNR
jgi:ribosomal protein S18 acetylase RimI-like enzyme